MKQLYALLLLVCLTHTVTAQDCSTISGNISPALTTICEGSSVQLTATGGSSYEWRLNGAIIDGETGSTINATQAGAYSALIKEGDCSVPASNIATVILTVPPTGFIFPGNASMCQGGTTRLTAIGGNTYTWFRDGVEINGENNAAIDVTQPGTYSVIMHQGNCSAEALNKAEVTISGNPTGTISPASATICQGSSVMLTASGGSSYTWFRNGNQVFGQTGETINATQGGTYSVVIHDGECSAEASNTSEVTVNNAPSGNITPALSSICAGGAVELTATGGSSYTWFRNGNEIEGQTGATLTATEAGLYSAIVRDGDCSAPAANTSLVAVTPVPVGSISPATSGLCEGETITLTANGGTSYTWFKDGNEIADETGARLTISEPGIYSAIIRQGQCSGPASNTSVITQSSLPTGTISPENGTICQGGSLELTASGGTSYTWYRNGDVIGGRNDATLTVRRAGTYSVTIHQGSCSAPASNTVVINEASAPTGTITPAAASYCEGGSALLTASGGSSYAWFRNGALIQGQTGATLNATQPGTYTVTIKQGECTGPASNSAVVTVNAKPSGSISASGTVMCGNGSVTLTANGGTSYSWLRDDVVIEGSQSAELVVTQPGTYSVIIKNAHCESPGSNTITVSAESTDGVKYPDVFARPGAPVQLEARSIGTSYEWTPPTGLSNPASRTPTATVASEQEYLVKITTENGCVIKDTVSIKLNSAVFVATGFTPNGNGKNDLLRPIGALKSIESFKVFNRWGQLMFQTTQINAGWDGKFRGTPQPSDSYTWFLIATGADAKPIKLSGKAFLIR